LGLEEDAICDYEGGEKTEAVGSNELLAKIVACSASFKSVAKLYSVTCADYAQVVSQFLGSQASAVILEYYPALSRNADSQGKPFGWNAIVSLTADAGVARVGNQLSDGDSFVRVKGVRKDLSESPEIDANSSLRFYAGHEWFSAGIGTQVRAGSY